MFLQKLSINTKVFLLLVFVALLWGCGGSNEVPVEVVVVEDTIPPEPEIEYGFNLDSFNVHIDSVGKNEFLADILLKYHISYPEIDQILARGKEVFNANRDFRPDHKYTVLCSTDSLGKAQCFIYEKNAVDFVVFDFRDSMFVYAGAKEVDVEERTLSGVIDEQHNSPWLALAANGLSDRKVALLSTELSEIYAWTIDFFKLQQGDKFKMIYEEKFVEGAFVGLGDVRATFFHNRGADLYAFHYTQDSIPDYFDEKGNGLRKAFLKAPLKYSRISSRYSKKRFHPVQKRYKAHLGTDYAAPKGTPIMATGDGVVVASSYGKGNGNYVKVKHNDVYTTQYLHMSKRAAKKGQRVKQGDVIGYVGSTGLATGPHVCYRFWKNGSQVDHLQEKFPTSEPIKEAHKASYTTYKDSMKTLIDAIEFAVADSLL